MMKVRRLVNISAVNELCDKWYAFIETGQAYRLSRLTAKAANPQYNKTRHAAELQITKVSYLIIPDAPHIRYAPSCSSAVTGSITDNKR